MGYRKADGWSREDVQCPYQGLRFEVPDLDVTILAAPKDSSVPRGKTENAPVAGVETMSKEQASFGTLPNLMKIVQCKVIAMSTLGSVPLHLHPRFQSIEIFLDPVV